MKTILLNSVYYELAPGSRIIQRAINPWRAKLGATGGREFSDFGEADFEEYHDLRNGIGLESDLPSESNRQDWTEGVDTSTPRSAVLGVLINTADYAAWVANTAYVLLDFRIPTTANGYVYECTTAGTSHASTQPTWPTTVGNTVADGTVTWTCRAYLATVKIIDFQSNTYFIQNSRILKWDGTNLDGVDNSLASPLDAIVVTDNTDEYLIVSSALSARYTPDGTTWSNLTNLAWAKPDSTDNPADWDDEDNAIDGDTATYANNTTQNKYLQLFLINPIKTDSCRIWVSGGAADPSTDIDFYYDGGWVNIFSGTIARGEWKTKTNSAGIKTVEKARVRFPTATPRLNEFQFSAPPTGYLAEYENRLYSISADGKKIHYSAARDIDDYGSSLSLTGNFGTVYGLFEGKLMSDGSPALYFHGTRGLFSIDITNEKAYGQEVEYPPLTFAGHAGKYWNANLWLATGYGLLKISPSLATHIGPDLDDGLPSGYQGYIYDMETVNNWLVFCVNGGTTDKSSILKRNANLGGNLQVYTTSAVDKAIPCLLHSPSSQYTNGRLWFGEGTVIKYMMFPDTTSNVKQISTYQYVAASSGHHLKLPVLRKLAAVSKTALGVAGITKSCNTSDFLTVYYGLNGAAPTTELGTLKTSPRPALLTFGSGLGTEFYRIQLAVKFERGGTNTNSPELESLIFYYIATPAAVHSWTFQIQAIEDDAEEIIADFEAIRDTNTLVAFYPTGDPNKTSYNVKLSQMPLEFSVDNQQTRKGHITVIVQQIFQG